MTTTPQQQYTLHFVTSKDGTQVAYRQFGSGPGLVLVHGGMQAAQNFMQLGKALADSYTIYIPDRRGRGKTGLHGQAYSLEKESDDITAILEETGAVNIFGLSSGAIVTIETALRNPRVKQIAIYEPPIPIQGQKSPLNWLPRFERALQADNLGAAMAAVIKGTGDRSFFSLLPRFLLTAMLNLGTRENDNNVKEGDTALGKLIPTMHYDAKLVAEVDGKIDKFKTLKARVLLMGGNRSQPYLKATLTALEKLLPGSKRILFKGQGHLAADNSGKPEWVARELKNFFGKTT